MSKKDTNWQNSLKMRLLSPQSIKEIKSIILKAQELTENRSIGLQILKPFTFKDIIEKIKRHHQHTE